jgi:hypothetical protein
MLCERYNMFPSPLGEDVVSTIVIRPLLDQLQVSIPSRGRRCVNQHGGQYFCVPPVVSIPSRGRRCVNKICKTKGLGYSMVSIPSRGRRCVNQATSPSVKLPSGFHPLSGKTLCQRFFLFTCKRRHSKFPSPLGEDVVSTYRLSICPSVANCFHPLSGKTLCQLESRTNGTRETNVSIPSRGRRCVNNCSNWFNHQSRVSIPSRGRRCVNAGKRCSRSSFGVSIPSRGRRCVNKKTVELNVECIQKFPSPLGEDVVSTNIVKPMEELTENVSIPSRGRRCVNTSLREPCPARVPARKSTHLFSLDELYSHPADFRR